METLVEQMSAQQRQMAAQQQQHEEQMEALLSLLKRQTSVSATARPTALPAFTPFDPAAELWKDYRSQRRTQRGLWGGFFGPVIHFEKYMQCRCFL